MKFTIRCDRCTNQNVQSVKDIYELDWFCIKCESDSNTYIYSEE
jgi:hypothetical protein